MNFTFRFNGDSNWGLKLLALILAIVIYQALKNEPILNRDIHDREIIHTTP